MKKARIIPLIAGFFFMLITQGFLIISGLAYHKKTVLNQEDTKKQYENLEDQERLCWQELYNCTGISYEMVFSLKEQIKSQRKCKKFFRKTHNKLSSYIFLLVQEVCKEFGVDKKNINIIAGDRTGVCDFDLTICEKELAHFDRTTIKSIIAHELIHFLQDDSFIREAIYVLLTKKAIAPNEDDDAHIFHKILRFQEIRADVLASLRSTEYAHGSLNGLKRLLKKDKKSVTHPSPSERIEAITCLCPI